MSRNEDRQSNLTHIFKPHIDIGSTSTAMSTPPGFLNLAKAFFRMPHISGFSLPFNNILNLKYPLILDMGAGAGPAILMDPPSVFKISRRPWAVFKAKSSFLALTVIFV